MSDMAVGGSTERDVPKALDVISVRSCLSYPMMSRLMSTVRGATILNNCQKSSLRSFIITIPYYQNEIVKELLIASCVVRTMASEEEDEPVEVSLPKQSTSTGFVVVFDPLDGSRNIEVSIPTGRSVHKRRMPLRKR